MTDTKLREKAAALIAFTQLGPRFIEWVQAVTEALAPAPEKVAKMECVKCWKPQDPNALHCVAFATTDKAHRQQVEYRYTCQPAPPEPAKVECPNCGEMTERSHSRYEGPGPDKWACQPAPPEPAAPEMPGRKGWSDDPSWIVDCAATELRRLAALSREGIRNTSEDWPETCASRLENLWRNLAQPVAVGMTPELRRLIQFAENNIENRCGEIRFEMPGVIAAVREQAAQGRKVREFIDRYEVYVCTDKGKKLRADALAECDAAEGKVAG